MPRGALRFRNMTVGKQPGELGRLRVLGGPDSGVVFIVTAPRVTIGRGEENDIVLTDLKASRKHAEISLTQAGAMIIDLGSSHGLVVNGVPQRQAQLRNGDKIGFGQTVAEFIGSEVGATRMIASQPGRVSVAVGTGSSGLTQFVPRPNIYTTPPPGASRQAVTESIFEKNKKMVLILGVLMALAAMVPEVEKKHKAKNQYREPPELGSLGRMPGSLGRMPVDPNTLKLSESQFRECFREFQARNYLRAQVACETSLQIYGDHPLARTYLETTKKEMENEAKEHFTAAKRDEEATRWPSALNRYNAVKRLFAKDQSNPLFKEADSRSVELRKKLKVEEE